MNRRDFLKGLAGFAVAAGTMRFASLGREELDRRIAPLLSGRIGTYEGFTFFESEPVGLQKPNYRANFRWMTRDEIVEEFRIDHLVTRAKEINDQCRHVPGSAGKFLKITRDGATWV